MAKGVQNPEMIREEGQIVEQSKEEEISEEKEDIKEIEEEM